ncbi:MAG: 50S ribosomal protein L1 [Microgenomates group bacterium]|jgi:large subunit ribosomal protein L1
MGKTKIKKLEETVTENTTQKEVVDHPVVEAAETEVEAKKEVKEQVKKEKKSKASKKVKKVRSKKYQEVLEKADKNSKLPALEAVKRAQENSITKFEGTIEAHINTSAKNLRGLINMPFAQGKKLRILAFGDNADKSGADIIGSEEIIAGIDKGKIDFDVVVTTPEWMPKLAKLARILGPRSLMPNPKNGTITENLEKAVADLQGGKTEYKTEKDGTVIHLSVGKTSQAPEEIVANLKVIYNTVGRSKVKKISLSPTMGPSARVDLQSL